MSEKVMGSLWSILRGSPMAVALLVMFWMGNAHWGQIISEITNRQAQFNERMTSAIEKLANTNERLSQIVTEVHAHLDANSGRG